MRENPFKIQARVREQNLKERPESQPAETAALPAPGEIIGLEPRRRRKQTFTVYLDKELMGRVQRLAKQKDVAASAVIEACVKMALEQLEN